MDDPLVPSEYGNGVKWGFLLLSGAMFVFIVVTIVLTAVTGKADWIIAAIALLLMVGTTITFGQWIRSGQLEESKHTYLAALQLLAILLLCGAILSNVYAAGTFSVTGVVSGAKASLLNRQGGTITVNGKEMDLPQSEEGVCLPLILLEGVKTKTDYTIAMKNQPGQANCRVNNGKGTVGKELVNKVSVTCSPMFNVGGSVGGLLPGYTPLVLSMKINGGVVGTASIATDTNAFVFNNKIADSCATTQSGTTFVVEVTSPPMGPDGKATLSCTSTAMSSTVPADCKSPVDNGGLKFVCTQKVFSDTVYNGTV